MLKKMSKVQQGEVCPCYSVLPHAVTGDGTLFSHNCININTSDYTLLYIHIFSFLSWLKLLEIKIWGKILEGIIWSSSAIERETGRWWNVCRIVFNSKPQVVTCTKMQTSIMFGFFKTKTTKTKKPPKQTKNMLHCFRSCWAFYCL